MAVQVSGWSGHRLIKISSCVLVLQGLLLTEVIVNGNALSKTIIIIFQLQHIMSPSLQSS